MFEMSSLSNPHQVFPDEHFQVPGEPPEHMGAFRITLGSRFRVCGLGS